MNDINGMPEKYTKLVGTKQLFSGGLFSYKKDEPEKEYDVLKWRWGSAQIMDMKTMKIMHPTVEFLIKADGMRTSRWTRPFPVREIVLKEDD